MKNYKIALSLAIFIAASVAISISAGNLALSPAKEKRIADLIINIRDKGTNPDLNQLNDLKDLTNAKDTPWKATQLDILQNAGFDMNRLKVGYTGGTSETPITTTTTTKTTPTTPTYTKETSKPTPTTTVAVSSGNLSLSPTKTEKIEKIVLKIAGNGEPTGEDLILLKDLKNAKKDPWKEKMIKSLYEADFEMDTLGADYTGGTTTEITPKPTTTEPKPKPLPKTEEADWSNGNTIMNFAKSFVDFQTKSLNNPKMLVQTIGTKTFFNPAWFDKGVALLGSEGHNRQQIKDQLYSTAQKVYIEATEKPTNTTENNQINKLMESALSKGIKKQAEAPSWIKYDDAIQSAKNYDSFIVFTTSNPHIAIQQKDDTVYFNQDWFTKAIELLKFEDNKITAQDAGVVISGDVETIIYPAAIDSIISTKDDSTMKKFIKNALELNGLF